MSVHPVWWAGWLCFVCLLQPPIAAHAQADTADSGVCARVARDAEQDFGLPPGILRAIGQAESGGWPWTANVDGVAETYHSRSEAVAGLTRVRSPQPSDVDVGCFQISMRYHGAAFGSIGEALDPATNARYAARFLSELHERLGDWARAVGAYHSATEPLGMAYRERVMALWKDAPSVTQVGFGLGAPADDGPRWRVIPIGAPIDSGVHVWSLASLPAGPGVGTLPRVITLGH